MMMMMMTMMEFMSWLFKKKWLIHGPAARDRLDIKYDVNEYLYDSNPRLSELNHECVTVCGRCAAVMHMQVEWRCVFDIRKKASA